MAAAVDSVAAVVVAESAIAGKRFTPIEQAKGAMKAWHPFFVCTDPARDVPCGGRDRIGVRCDEQGGEGRRGTSRHPTGATHSGPPLTRRLPDRWRDCIGGGRCIGWDVVRGDVTNLNRIDPLLGQDVRDDHDLFPSLKLFSLLQDPERRL